MFDPRMPLLYHRIKFLPLSHKRKLENTNGSRLILVRINNEFIHICNIVYYALQREVQRKRLRKNENRGNLTHINIIHIHCF